ncbi:hypothetical protein OH720_10980 [Pseudomonas sp. WJP1]|uniref:hypothetical protein n=1 Tax=Pseudomonas sp. WJP1 TaxID=2986947 RepID=UPI002349589B|nr:hypothetical protein [Pseudomonas sp. WJP1]WCM53504.1 hypothetical protein OH720_10980 [Pseudomonas sp. WJP1]
MRRSTGRKSLDLKKTLGVKRLEKELVKYSDQTVSAAEKHKRELQNARASEYLAGQTRGVLAGVASAIDYMRGYSNLNTQTKYGPGLIDDVQEWLLDAEAGPSGTPVDIETLILQLVEKFTKRKEVADRFKKASSDGDDPLTE